MESSLQTSLLPRRVKGTHCYKQQAAMVITLRIKLMHPRFLET